MNTNDTVTNGATAPVVETPVQVSVAVPTPKKGLGKGRTKGAVSHALVSLADLNATLNPSAQIPVSRIWAQNLQIANKPVTSKGEMSTPASSLRARVEHTDNGNGSGQIRVEITEAPEAPQSESVPEPVASAAPDIAGDFDSSEPLDGTSPVTDLSGDRDREAVAV